MLRLDVVGTLQLRLELAIRNCKLLTYFHSWFLYVMNSSSQSETCSLFSNIFGVFSYKKNFFLVRKGACN